MERIFFFRINLSLGSYGGIDKNSSLSVGCLILFRRFQHQEVFIKGGTI
ncbi:hypothetical protein MUS_4177 [Bacillus sp. CN2]|nr:hypothetical protein MUS_4177 [Bacillus sp. CN2]